MKNLIILIFGLGLILPEAYAEEPTPAEETTEEVQPIPSEKVDEVEGAKEAKEDTKEEKKEEKEEKAEKEKIAETDMEAVEDAVALWKAIESQDWPLAGGFFVMLLV